MMIDAISWRIPLWNFELEEQEVSARQSLKIMHADWAAKNLQGNDEYEEFVAMAMIVIHPSTWEADGDIDFPF